MRNYEYMSRFHRGFSTQSERMPRIAQTFFALVLLIGVVASQYFYDQNKLRVPTFSLPQPPQQFIKIFDLGLHSAAAAFFWVDGTMTELPFLRYGFEKYSKDLQLVNNLDPRFSFPYYWTVLLLPNTTYKNALSAAIEIGERGVREADTDWRVSFYLATLYHLYKNDKTNAAKNFDLAARDPGAPFHIKRFSENYGIAPNVREQTKLVWQTISENTDDEFTRKRALAYVLRLNTFTFLEQAAKVYKQQYGKLPEKIDDLVSGGILRAIPLDPFGFEFYIYPDGTVGIKK